MRPFTANTGPGCGCGVHRRGFLAGLAGVGLSGVARAAPAPARNIVDVHAHYIPPALKGTGAQGPMAGWSPERHLEAMAEAGVNRSLLSITTPGVPGQGAATRPWIRTANEYAARLRDDHRQALGFFTYVTLTDIEGALAEIAYGFDTLKANGVGLFTSYGGKYLGDPAFDPVFAELNRRKAVVYVHPTSAACCAGALPGIPDTIIEYGTDTSRAITRYVYGGAARRYPDVRMIWSHSGGSLPFLIERFDFADRGPAYRAAAPNGFRAELAKMFFDVAQASNPVATGALRQVVPPGRIVFGTDYPYRTPKEHVDQLEAGRVFDRQELAGLYRGNVAAQMPELLT